MPGFVKAFGTKNGTWRFWIGVAWMVIRINNFGDDPDEYDFFSMIRMDPCARILVLRQTTPDRS